MLTSLAITSALLSAAFWAMASIAIGRFLASGVVSPAAATLFKNSAAAFTFLLCALIFGGHWPVGDAWAWLLFSGFLGFTVSDTLYFAAFQRCGVQTAATVMLLNVPIATVLALPLAGDEIHTGAIPFMVVVLVGVVLVILDSRVAKPDPSDMSESSGAPAAKGSYWLGVLLAVVAAFAIGTAVPLGRGGFDGVGVFIGAFIRLTGGALGAIPIALISGLRRGATSGGEVARLIEPVFAAPGPGSVWGRASVIGVSCAVVGLFPYHYAQRELPSGIATTLFATTPLFTLPLAVLLGSRVGWRGWLGTLAGFLGVLGIVNQGGDGPAPVRPTLTDSPVVALTSQGALPEGLGARRPSFVSARPSLHAPGVEGSKELADAAFIAVHSGPVLFGGSDGPFLNPREVRLESSAGDLARGHWADVPFACQLASGGLLFGTPQVMGEGELGYGLRLALEVEGPPALDLGWIHGDQSDVLHGFGAALPLRTGGAEVIWVDDRDGDEVPSMALYSREVDALGVLAEETLLDGSICDCCPPDIAELSDGSRVIAYRHRSLEDVRDIYLMRKDPREATWGAPAVVHADGWELDGCPVNGPAVAASERVMAVAWFTQANEAATPEIRVAFSTDRGQTFGDPYSVVVGATLGRVAIVAAATGPDDDRFLLVHLALNDEADLSGFDASWRAGLVRPDGAASEFKRFSEVDGSRQSGRLDLTLAAPGIAQAIWTGPKGLVSAQLNCNAEAPTKPE
jgi:drug/metabolite transporter (DMT)-like permease